ncbi:hypothetical protein LGK97_00585 [Clostridium sp. CS001]|uniref:hypothetical protein n=1 Tax=Clostridium sp. CS001 TaxID=2880648 RepID=UPI001CF5912A|nr:hypothetical protein [Clostridium sp. CS001]MCB2288260.1 hypothetical protein [Clostridium sp. CS001]
MKINKAFLLFLGLSIIEYGGVAEAKPIAQAVTIAKNQFETTNNNLKIINAITTVKRGGTGIITIQGIPNTKYSIETSYKLLNKTIPVIQWRRTDITGVATFNWIVSMETSISTHDATISGGGSILKTSHRVIK